MSKQISPVFLKGQSNLYDFDSVTNQIIPREGFFTPEINPALPSHIKERHAGNLKKLASTGRCSVSGLANLLLQPTGEGVDGYVNFISTVTGKTLRDSSEIYVNRQVRKRNGIAYLTIQELVESNNKDLASLFDLSYVPEEGGRPSSYNSLFYVTYECRECKRLGRATKGNGHITPYMFLFKELKCPTCFPNARSLPEQALYDYVENHSNYEILYWKKTENEMLYYTDIIIRNLTTGQITAIEYDGSHWHKDKVEWDIFKTKTVLDENRTFKALRLRAGNLVSLKRALRSKRYREAQVSEEIFKMDAGSVLTPLFEQFQI